MMRKIAFICLWLVTASFVAPSSVREQFPYKDTGLSERQAAAHLLNRFTFGPWPGQVDEVVKLGLEKWFDQQLDGSQDDKTVEKLLADYDTQHLSNAEIADTYERNKKDTLKPKRELIRQTVNQKIIRAVYSNNQLHEVL